MLKGSYYNPNDEIFSDDDVPFRQSSMGNQGLNTGYLDLQGGAYNNTSESNNEIYPYKNSHARDKI